MQSTSGFSRFLPKITGALRRPGSGRYAARGFLLFATWTSRYIPWLEREDEAAASENQKPLGFDTSPGYHHHEQALLM